MWGLCDFNSPKNFWGFFSRIKPTTYKLILLKLFNVKQYKPFVLFCQAFLFDFLLKAGKPAFS